MTDFYAPFSANAEIVGDVSNLELKEGGYETPAGTQLTVIGSVTNCFASSGHENDCRVIQWHHTLDTQQLLDADSAGDDDLRLTKPALDNAHELMTG